MQLATTIKNTRAQVVSDAFDAGTAVLRLLNAAEAMVCELEFPNPCAADISNGVLTFNNLAESLVLLTDTVDSAVIVAADDSVLAEPSIGVTGSGAELTLPSLDLIQGSLLRITGWTVSEL